MILVESGIPLVSCSSSFDMLCTQIISCIVNLSWIYITWYLICGHISYPYRPVSVRQHSFYQHSIFGLFLCQLIRLLWYHNISFWGIRGISSYISTLQYFLWSVFWFTKITPMKNISHCSIREIVDYAPPLPVSAYSNGMVLWAFPALLKSTCKLDVDFFLGTNKLVSLNSDHGLMICSRLVCI